VPTERNSLFSYYSHPVFSLHPPSFQLLHKTTSSGINLPDTTQLNFTLQFSDTAFDFSVVSKDGCMSSVRWAITLHNVLLKKKHSFIRVSFKLQTVDRLTHHFSHFSDPFTLVQDGQITFLNKMLMKIFGSDDIVKNSYTKTCEISSKTKLTIQHWHRCKPRRFTGLDTDITVKACACFILGGKPALMVNMLVGRSVLK